MLQGAPVHARSTSIEINARHELIPMSPAETLYQDRRINFAMDYLPPVAKLCREQYYNNREGVLKWNPQLN